MLRQIGAFWDSLVGGEAPLPAITGPEVLSRCEEAYRALDSYHGTTRVSQQSSRPGGRVHKSSTRARIWFSRPGSIRIEGTLPRRYGEFRHGTFAIISDGNRTFKRWTTGGTRWEEADSAESAVAEFTGVSRGACTPIPSLLLATEWGRPWRATSRTQLETAIERVRGIQAYRVEFTGRFARTTVWIDCRTMLLLKLRDVRDDEEIERAMGDDFASQQEDMLAQLPEDARKIIAKERALGPSTTVATETFVNVRTNGAIPPAVFKLPS